jgi:hypothetical protein
MPNNCTCAIEVGVSVGGCGLGVYEGAPTGAATLQTMCFAEAADLIYSAAVTGYYIQ